MSKSTDRIPPEHPFVSDHGEAKYFHGRKNALQKFANQIRDANKKNGDIISLIQAAPGAGKTALLAECRRLAEVERWKIARIKPSDLWDTNTLLFSLGRAGRTRWKESGWGGHVDGGVDLPWVGSVKAGGGYESEKMIAPRTTMDVLNDNKEALLLILDEAQRLWSLA